MFLSWKSICFGLEGQRSSYESQKHCRCGSLHQWWLPPRRAADCCQSTCHVTTWYFVTAADIQTSVRLSGFIQVTPSRTKLLLARLGCRAYLVVKLDPWSGLSAHYLRTVASTLHVAVRCSRVAAIRTQNTKHFRPLHINIKTGHLYSAFSWVFSPLKRSEWHVITRDHTVLPATNTLIHERNEPSCLWSAAHRRTLPVLIFRFTESGRLSWPGWLVTYRSGMPARRRSPDPVGLPTDR